MPKGRCFPVTERLYDYDPAAVLNSDERIALFMADAFETGDAGYIARALGVVARANGMCRVSREVIRHD